MDRLGSLTPRGSERAKGLDRLDLDCPPLPHTLFEAMRLLENPGAADHARVLRMVRNDPLVVVRLLRIVNSPYYGFSRRVESADRALRLLGPSSVAEIVMSMNVARLQTALEGPSGPVLGRLIRHAIATAYISDWLWKRLRPLERGRQAFSAGLLSDLGKITLIYNHPEAAKTLYEDGSARPDDQWLQAERDAFGCTHLEAADYITEHLELPPSLKSTFRGAMTDVHLELVVSVASVSARALGFWFEQPMKWEDCCALPVWGDLAEAFPEDAGDPELFQLELHGAKDDVAQFVFQLLARRSNQHGPPGSGGSRPGRESSDRAA